MNTSKWICCPSEKNANSKKNILMKQSHTCGTMFSTCFKEAGIYFKRYTC